MIAEKSVFDKKVIGIGSALVDLSFTCAASPRLHTSNPSVFHKSPGGVIRNIIHHLALLGSSTALISAFGKDPDGEWLMDELQTNRVDTRHCRRHDRETGNFVSVNDPEGHLFIGAVSEGIEDLIDVEYLENHTEFLKTASLLLADGNLAVSTLKWLIEFADRHQIPLILETVSVPKTDRINEALPGPVLLTKPNMDELEVFGHDSDSFYSSEERITWLQNHGVKYVWLSLGAEGSILYDNNQAIKVPAMDVKIIDSLGAGDAALTGWIWAWLHGKDLISCVRYGHAAAAIIMERNGAIARDLNTGMLESYYQKFISTLS